ncbi:MAG: amidohydrolase family protein [Oscillospiraceae bacterium]|nr:amidohydrolase family protein [Oscillospiraceae bacterium]
MKADYLLRGGRVIDPSAGTDEIRDVAIRGDRIVEADDAAQIVDIAGCIVCPGLIDFHAHLFCGVSGISIDPDLLIAQGTTAAVDAGSAGSANYERFSDIVRQSRIQIRSFLNFYPFGQLGGGAVEDYSPALCRIDDLARTIDAHRDEILGLKIRLSRGIVPEGSGADALRRCVAAADELEKRLGLPLRVCVHTTDPPVPAGELADCLRPGDIFCHCYQGVGDPIVTKGGAIEAGVLRARERGVLFDAANGKSNFSLAVAKKALAAGFLPDIISTDLTAMTIGPSPHVGSLPRILSKYLALGLSLPEILRRCTEIPARLMGLEGQIGTLRPGARADLAVLRLEDRRWEQLDHRGEALRCEQLLVPQLTVLGGEIVTA